MRGITGGLLVATGVLHTVVGVIEGWGRLMEIGRAGFVNAIEPFYPRMSVFWFLFTGFMMILLGQLCFWIERRFDHKLPAFIGWELLVLSVIGAVLMPVSGIWLIIAQALYIIFTASRTRDSIIRG